jgi:uncharacterized protein (DUF58 family)
MMKRLLLLSGLAYGLLLLGLATLKGGLLALALPLIVYLGAAILYGPEKLRLKSTRTISAGRVSQGALVDVAISVVNEGSWLETVLIEDAVPQPLELTDGEPRVLVSLPPGGTVELAYTVRGKRGGFEFQDIQVTASDHLGLFRRQAVLPAPGKLVVLPEVLKLRRVTIRPLRTRAYAGPIPARRGGSGVEFFGVREYQVGDPFRWINWRISARHPQALFTNEFELERIADVGLILDARRRSNIESEDDALFEHSVHAAASLAQVFLNDGNRVGLLIYGHLLNWTFPGYGKIQRERILQSLARAKIGESMVFNYLEYLPTRLFPGRSQIVLVSPLCPDDLPTLVRLRARGYQLLVISPDPVSFEAKMLGSQPDAALATRIARLERKLLLHNLAQAGIQVVDWQVERPFDRVALASLGRTPQWYRAVGLAA